MFSKWSQLNDTPPETADADEPMATGWAVDRGLSALVDASRRISRLRNADDVVRLAVREAIGLTEAEVGAYIEIDDAGTNRFAYQSHPELFTGPSVSGAVLTSAIAERRPACEVVVDEPAIGIPRIAMAAAPVVARSRLAGMLIVFRDPDLPFGNSALEALSLLAPVAGSTIGAASARRPDELDAVTQLANRRGLNRDIVDAGREGQVGFASIRIDRLAGFTARHGVARTEDLLRQIALTIKSGIRPDDIAYRSGEDEFTILLPGATREATAWVAERLRQSITAIGLTKLDEERFVTASIGVAAGVHDDPQAVAERARSAMSEAEELGCDRVVADESA